MKTEPVHLGDILSITTGVLVSPRGTLGVRGIIAFITGTGDQNDCTITDSGCLELAEVCRNALLAQYPKLESIDPPNTNTVKLDEWLNQLISEHGEHLDVRQVA